MAVPSDKSDHTEVQKRYRKPIALLSALGCLFSLAYLYTSGLPIVLAIMLALLSLVIAGMMISISNGFKGSYGLYLLGTKRGIATIERLSKRNRSFWRSFAEWGLVLSFGLASYLIFRKRINLRIMVVGILSLLFILILVLPNLGLSFRFITLPGISSVVQYSPVAPGQLSPYSYLLYALSTIGGFSLFIFVLILYEAVGILYSVGLALVGVITAQPNYSLLNQQIPGIAPVIPGITIPLFAGILSLAVLLVVHEFSHGILARLSRIRITKVGVILFGIIPVGAFVEPSEKEVNRLKRYEQDRIFIAGISANFLFMLLFFVLTILTALYLEPRFFSTGVAVQSTEVGYPAYNVIAPGSVILRWNGYPIKNLSSFVIAAKNDTPFSTVSLVTDKGGYAFRTNATGKIGVIVQESLIQTSKGLGASATNFLYEFFVLSFVLNFLVATINLLPLPAFDGWRIYKNRIRNRKILTAISAVTITSIIALALPWIWVR